MDNIEYEVRLLEINHDEIVTLLESMGATKVKDGLQKRYVYDFTPVQKQKIL